MAKNIAILGSTGSIGTQTLDVARNLGIRVEALTCQSNIELLEKQAREFRPSLVGTGSSETAKILSERLSDMDVKVVCGQQGMLEAVRMDTVDTVVTSVVGIAGLVPTVEAVRHGKNIALANKETLVTAGAIVMEEARKAKVRIFPVDSEHSAIFQCLMGNRERDVDHIVLTASGGPFRGMDRASMRDMTPAQALRHPSWKMGNKITIDSATLMNKGFEVIEARWLFNMGPDRIKVVIHPQSIIHSMVAYVDGSVIAQLGSPDMRIPIQLALTYPARETNAFSRLDLTKTGSLTFEEPDMDSFPCLAMAYDALKIGGTMPAVLNAVNELAVSLFLQERIRFGEISEIIGDVMQAHNVNSDPCLDDILEADRWARQRAGELLRCKQIPAR